VTRPERGGARAGDRYSVLVMALVVRHRHAHPMVACTSVAACVVDLAWGADLVVGVANEGILGAVVELLPHVDGSSGWTHGHRKEIKTARGVAASQIQLEDGTDGVAAVLI